MIHLIIDIDENNTEKPCMKDIIHVPEGFTIGTLKAGTVGGATSIMLITKLPDDSGKQVVAECTLKELRAAVNALAHIEE